MEKSVTWIKTQGILIARGKLCCVEPQNKVSKKNKTNKHFNKIYYVRHDQNDEWAWHVKEQLQGAFYDVHVTDAFYQMTTKMTVSPTRYYNNC